MTGYYPNHHKTKCEILTELNDLYSIYGKEIDIEIKVYLLGVKVILRKNERGNIRTSFFDVDIQSSAHILLLRRSFGMALRQIGIYQENINDNIIQTG